MKFICFDTEGPLSPQDNAYELMRLLFPEGARVFEIISRYDDLLTLEKRKGYQPGDTLALIVPFLFLHNVTADHVRQIAEKASLTEGARELVSYLMNAAWWVGNITTSYEDYATAIAAKVGIPPQNLACTRFHPHESPLSKADSQKVAVIEGEIASLTPVKDDSRIKDLLDSFFFQGNRGSPSIRRVVRAVKPVGGERKLEWLQRFARNAGVPLNEAVAVGDSITDAAMLEGLNQEGGLAIAFNANEYALPYATMGLASRKLSSLKEPLDAWAWGGMAAVEALIREREKEGGSEEDGYFHWLRGRDSLEEPLEVHLRLRRLVRKEAAKLG